MQRFVSAKCILDGNGDSYATSVPEASSIIFNKRTEESGWACGQCTFQNQLEDRFCQICNSSRSVRSSSGIISCPLCTYENSSDSLECLMCGSNLKETKERQQNEAFLPSSCGNSNLKDNLSLKPRQQVSDPSRKTGPSVSVSLVRRSSIQPNKTTSSRDLVDIDSDTYDEEEIYERKVTAGTAKSSVKKQSTLTKEDDESEEDCSDDEYDYSEDGTYSQASDDDEDEDDSDSSDEESEEDESDEEIDDGEILVNTPPRSLNGDRRNPIIINDDIDQFDSSSDVSVSAFFSSTKNSTSSTSRIPTTSRNVESFLSNKPRELKPSLPEVSAHYWSVKYLMRKGVCAINFDEFTLDKGVSNPNSNSLLNSGKKRNKVTSVDEIYEKRREKRGGKKKRNSVAMMKRLQDDGSLVAPTKKKRKRVKGEPKKRRSTTRKRKIGADSTAKPKRSKSTSSKVKVKVMPSSDGWISTKPH